MDNSLNAEFGNHFSFIYKREEQLFSVLIPFFSQGLHSNQKCIYISDEISKEKVSEEFLKKNIDLSIFLKSRQFIILTSKETYLKKGFFEPETMISTLRETEKNAIEEGYLGVRVAGDSSWISSGIKGAEKIMEYESEVNMFIFGSKICALCLYDERKINPDLLSESIHCHPELIFYGKRFENIYYSPHLLGTKEHLPIPLGSYEIIKRDFVRKSDF